jgi:bacterioferritin-associated ferredoxin
MNAADRPLPTDALHLLTTDPGPWLSCDDCFRLVDRYVEALVSDAGEKTSAELAAMPAHLSGCSACAEEAATLLLLAATDEGVDPAQALHRLTVR